MKKTLLVAAMMASFTGAAVAQNSVTLYGRLSTALVYESVKFDDKAATTLNFARGAGTYNQFSTGDGFDGGTSLFGFRGVEDLGNGLKASFVFEKNFVTTTGGETARISALTVSSNSWGSVSVGFDSAVGNTLMSGVDALGSGYGVGHGNNSMGVLSVTRVGNQVQYLTPSFNGFRFGTMYSFKGTAVRGNNPAVTTTTYGTSNQNRLVQGGFRYANGPIVAAALYTQINPANNQFDRKAKNWTIGGTYDLKVVKIHAAYGQNIDGIITGSVKPGIVSGDFGQSGSGAIVAAGRTNQYSLGLTAPVGAAGKVAFNFGQLMPSGNFNTAATDTQTNVGISYTYSLSKRTSLYAGYSYMQNFGTVSGLTVSQLGAGLRHNF